MREQTKMDRVPVSSSSLLSVGYDAETETLEIEFNSGGVYQYYNVPQVIYDGLMQAGSCGQYFYANIRYAFPCAKL
jgi:hypothetical protein